MRLFLPFLLLALVGAAPAFGQQQEKLVDRLMRTPEESKNLKFDTRQAAFGMNQSFEAKGAPVKSFSGERTFSTKAFEAKSFAGTQESWLAHSKYATKDANTKGQYEIPNVEKAAPVKTVEVADAREAGKAAEVHTSAEARHPKAENTRFLHLFGPPTNPSELSYDGELKPMTIEEIRTLLNKNK